MVKRFNKEIIIVDKSQINTKFYPCTQSKGLTGKYHRCDNIPLINLRSFGFSGGYVNYNDINSNPDTRYFVAYEVKVEIPSLISSDVIENVADSAVGGLHCQSGIQETIYRFYPVSQEEIEKEIIVPNKTEQITADGKLKKRSLRIYAGKQKKKSIKLKKRSLRRSSVDYSGNKNKKRIR